MQSIVVKAKAVTASFRVPESHTFQQTLPLPPITTLTGLVGAAVGLSFPDAIAYREKHNLRFGVIGNNGGLLRDLWKFNKVKTSYKADGSDRQDVLLREFLADFSMSLVIATQNKNIAMNLRQAFLRPFYALSAGNSDDIIKIVAVSKVAKVEEEPCKDFQNTILPDDHTSVYEPLFDLEKTVITETIRAPQVHLLPTAFEFLGDTRRVTERKMFTFVGSPISLLEPIPAVRVEELNVALM